jgi:SAM-dependent methyltransferase
MSETITSERRHSRRSTKNAWVEGIDATASWVYDAVCGTHPNIRCWHFQWLAVRALYGDLRRVLSQVRGLTLDLGCGGKPYASWLPQGEGNRVVGIDVSPGHGVDVVVGEADGFPFPDGAFDAVLCTQVLEHVTDLDGTLGEIHRVLAPSGLLVVSVPFIYQEHGAPRDFRRFSRHEAVRLLSERYEIVEAVGQGGLGSTVCMLILAWLHTTWERRSALRILKLPLLPAWLAAAMAVNGLGLLLNVLDGTDAFYSNVMVVARKRPVRG